MFLLLIALGLLPSILWLSLYLREDEHPEPKRLVIKAFLFGALAAPIAAGAEFVLIKWLVAFSLPPFIANLILFVVIIGMVEEFAKYFAVHVTEEADVSFNEPADAMVYLLIAALGFAAVENLLAVFSPLIATTGDALEIVFLRFISATLLHVLASAILGYFVAQKHFFHRRYQIITGVLVAGFLHGLYNILTLESADFERLGVTLIIVILLATMAVGVNILFYKLKKQYLT